MGEISETEKEQVIKSRIGQSAFKKALLAIEKKCRLCGVSDERFLVASHIKPWSQSNNQERLDVNNGLLLCPNHDALFDKGYISFDDDGMIVISDSLDEATKVFLNINETMKIGMNERQQKYMKWHQKKMYEILEQFEEWKKYEDNKISTFIQMISEMYDQTYRNVWDIIYGKSWKHLHN